MNALLRKRKNSLLISITNGHSWLGHTGVLEASEYAQGDSLTTRHFTVTRKIFDIVSDTPHQVFFINIKHSLDNLEY